MTRKVTSKDIAQRANVSQATVSYVINNAPGKSISESTKKRVLDAIAELNYIPNSAAKRLKSSRSNCVAVRLATTLSAPRYYKAIQGIRSYLEPRGYSILLCNDQRCGNTFNFIDACVNTQADGIIYISSNHSDVLPDVLKQIKSYDIPFSAIDCMASDSTVNSITYDYFASSYLRADHLLNKGFSKLIYIRPNYTSAKETARERGVCAAMHGHDKVTFNIMQIAGMDINSSLLLQNNESYGLERTNTLFIKNLINTVSFDTCFICSVRDVQQIIAQKLYDQHLTLQSAETAQWYERTISYDFSHYDAGFEAARSLLNIMENSTTVRKLTLQPILEPVEPDLF